MNASISFIRAAARLGVCLAFLAAPASVIAQGGGWQVQNLPTLPSGSTYHLTAVSAVNETDAWIAGYIYPSREVFVARTEDGGAAWQIVFQSATWPTINRMTFLPEVGFVAGTFDLFKSTTDGGVTWNQEMGNLPVPPGEWHPVGPGGHIYGLAVADSTHIWTAGWDGAGAGVVFHRKPERPQSDPINSNYPWWLELGTNNVGMYGIAAASQNVAWAVGYQGAIWKTSDGGNGWGPQTSGTGASLYDVVAIDANTLWAVGEAGTILKTTDGGANWVPQTSNTAENLRRIAALDASTAWAVGTAGVILHTTDGGTTWEPQWSGTRVTLTGVTAVSAMTAWVVGESNTILATADGGSGVWAAPTVTSVTPDVVGEYSYPYITLTFSGSGFRGGNLGVTIGGITASDVVLISPTLLQATAPIGLLGTVDATVTNEDGQSGTLPGAVVYLPTPGTTGLSPFHGVASGGYQVTINGFGLQEVAQARISLDIPDPPYSWYEDLPFTVVSPLQILVTLPVNASRPAGNALFVLTTAQNQEAYAGTFVLDPPGGSSPIVGAISPLHGGVGTSVTITGTGFPPSARASICGIPATTQSLSSTELVVRMNSPHVGMCDVELDYDGVNGITFYQVFLAGTLAAPVISNISPPAGAVDGGTAVTISGSGFTQTASIGVTFGGYPATVTSKTSTQLVVRTPHHQAGTVDVMVVLLNADQKPAAPPAVVPNGFLFRPAAAAWSDFNGDLKSDILWRHDTVGDVWLWPMDGASKVSDTYVRTVADTNWEIRGLGDQDGNGQADLLWRNAASGQLYLWSMNGGTPVGEIFAGTVDLAYEIVGTGDFDGDGKSDILWRHTTLGDLWIWLMDGAAPKPGGEVYVDRVDPGYVVKGVGDLNGDTKADIVWQHATLGDVWTWTMNGATRLGEVYVGTVAPATGYHIQGVADFDGNGKADLVWWHETRGEVWLWEINDGALVAQAWVGTVPDTNYQIAATGDYNGDTKADLLWRNEVNGEVWVWLMAGSTKLSETWVATVPDRRYRIIR
ncbi:MAG TPA: IPT/TIG domain-containing protein [Vicinamibacterales bacterium]|nr:IPT/TIG domain-containing protein [Vicinamibacterales bacterium]